MFFRSPELQLAWTSINSAHQGWRTSAFRDCSPGIPFNRRRRRRLCKANCRLNSSKCTVSVVSGHHVDTPSVFVCVCVHLGARHSIRPRAIPTATNPIGTRKTCSEECKCVRPVLSDRSKQRSLRTSQEHKRKCTHMAKIPAPKRGVRLLVIVWLSHWSWRWAVCDSINRASNVRILCFVLFLDGSALLFWWGWCRSGNLHNVRTRFVVLNGSDEKNGKCFGKIASPSSTKWTLKCI